jgi:hypothetical protein
VRPSKAVLQECPLIVIKHLIDLIQSHRNVIDVDVVLDVEGLLRACQVIAKGIRIDAEAIPQLAAASQAIARRVTRSGNTEGPSTAQASGVQDCFPSRVCTPHRRSFEP